MARRHNIEPITIEPITIKHEHTFTYAPKPKPVLLSISVLNDEGRRFELPVINLNGQYFMTSSIPLTFITDREEDAAKQFKMEMRLQYDTYR